LDRNARTWSSNSIAMATLKCLDYGGCADGEKHDITSVLNTYRFFHLAYRVDPYLLWEKLNRRVKYKIGLPEFCELKDREVK
jgi:hypothetical protein